MTVSWRIPEWVEISGKAPVIKLPYQARYADKVVKRLKPARVLGPVEGFAWILCSLACRLCIVFGSKYETRIRRRRVRDVLANVDHYLVASVEGLVDGRLVWEGRWKGDMIRVDNISCDAYVWDDGSVICGEETSRGPEHLRACLK